MLYNLQVKADNQKVYRKLSIKMRSIEALKKDAEAYCVMYAQDNQLNWHSISYRIIDDLGNVVYTHISNAQANKA